MGRITEAIAIINKEIMPGEKEYQHYFTYLSREEALHLRKIYRKAVKTVSAKLEG